jgi:hypothetical protein
MLGACEPFVRSRLFANNDTAVVCAELKRGDFGSTPAKGQTGEARRLLYRASLLSLVLGSWFLVLFRIRFCSFAKRFFVFSFTRGLRRDIPYHEHRRASLIRRSLFLSNTR